MMEENSNLEKQPHTISHKTSTWPTGLKAADEICHSMGISAEKLNDLAVSGYAPHYRIDHGPPLFRSSELKPWLAANLLRWNKGRSLPEIRLTIEADEIENIFDCPKEIQNIQNLRQLHIVGPGIYFLCENGKLVYIGQSLSPQSRISIHLQTGKTFDTAYFLPCPEYALNETEGALIRFLKPKLNGKIKNSDQCQAPAGTPEQDKKVLKRLDLLEESGLNQ